MKDFMLGEREREGEGKEIREREEIERYRKREKWKKIDYRWLIDSKVCLPAFS